MVIISLKWKNLELKKNVSFDDMANRQNTSSKKNGVLVFMQKCITCFRLCISGAKIPRFGVFSHKFAIIRKILLMVHGGFNNIF